MHKILGLNFVQTSSGCPEQYDVFYNGEKVGYVRLRYGYLNARYPDECGETIYKADIGDGLTGTFLTHDQRQYHLMQIAKNIHKIIDKRYEDDAKQLFRIEFEVDNGASYTRDAAIVKARDAEEANEKLKRMIGSIDSETCVSEIFNTYTFDGEIFTGRHRWK